MQNKRNRCSCGGRLKREGKLIQCKRCNAYVASTRSRVVLSAFCIRGRERDRVKYLKRKGSKYGWLRLSEAGELKGKDLLWAWNHLFLFNTMNKPLRIVYDDEYKNYNKGIEVKYKIVSKG